VDDGMSMLSVDHLPVASSTASITGSVTRWLLHFHGPAAYALVGALVFAEAALLVGFFLPGETAAVIGGVLAGAGSVNLEVMMTVVVLSAIIGDSVGYVVGRTAGPWLLERRPVRGSTAVARTTSLVEHRGGSAVFIGRFVTFARAVVPGLAGMSGLRYRTFLTFNVLGGLLWGVGYTVLGYVVGRSFARIVSDLSTASFVAVAVAGLVVTAYVVSRRHGRRPGSESTDTPAGGLSADSMETAGTPK
jgi:membrane protein DedA with SNARE-associated domain